MQYGIYSNLSITDDFSIFEFLSIGPKGVIVKRIIFTPTEIEEVFNLSLGDVTFFGELDANSVSNNGDRDKILATVAYCVEIFLNQYPERWVHFNGNSYGRTRLYRMAISANLKFLESKFYIYSKVDNEFVLFQKNVYQDGFLVRIKP